MIDLTKQYKTTAGSPVVVYEQVGDTVYGRIGLVAASWYEKDLVEVSPWDHIKKGDPVRFKDQPFHDWKYGVFFQILDGLPEVLSGVNRLKWNICEKISVEDLP